MRNKNTTSETNIGFIVENEEGINLDVSSFFWGVVVEVHKRYVFVSPKIQLKNNELTSIDTSDVWLGSISKIKKAKKRKERNILCVGDIVACKAGNHNVGHVSEELPQCVIEARLKRRNQFTRMDPMVSNRRHVIASNFDQVFIVASLVEPAVRWKLIDRYLVVCESEGVKPYIVLTKPDLMNSEKYKKLWSEIEYFKKLYQTLGYSVLTINANHSGKRMKDFELTQICTNKTSLLVGHSGVGKSSIVNSLFPEIQQETDETPISWKGRHTTSYASFIKVLKLQNTDDSTSFVIDTPGVKSFELIEYPYSHLVDCFREFSDFVKNCRYRECRHDKEKPCGIKDAVDRGLITKHRYESYLSMLRKENKRK